MKARLKFRRRRAIIVVAIIAGLAAIGGVTGYLFTRGNDTAGATNVGQQQTSGNDGVSTNDGNNDQANNPSNNDGQSNDGQNAGNNGNAQGDGTTGNADGTNAGGTATDGARNAGGATAGTGATGGAGAAGTGGGTGTTGATTTGTTTPAGGDATTVYEQVQDNIVVENPWETHQVNWTPEDFSATIASAQNLNVNKRNFTVTKTAETSTGSNSVNVNDTITYKITITNTEERVLNSVYVRDQIPDGTELVEGSISDNGVLNGSQINWNLWDLNLQNGATKTVQFTVKVTESAKKVGTIKNTAYADNTPSEDETKNPVINSKKEHEVLRNGKTLPAETAAKVNDQVRYTISVSNLGEVSAQTTIKDTAIKDILTKATLNGDIKVLVDNKEIEKIDSVDTLANGYSATVDAGKTLKVVFTVTINSIDGKIVNTATVGGDNNVITDETETTDYDIVKTSKLNELNGNKEDGKAEVGDTIDYTITITNKGSKEIKDLVVEDAKLEKTWGTKTKTIDSIPAGETKELTGTYTVEQSDVDKQEKIINKATAKSNNDEKDSEDPGHDVVEENGNISVEKKVSLDKKDYKDEVKAGNGDIASYKVTITNNYNVSVKITDLKDELTSQLVDETTNAGKLDLKNDDGKTLDEMTDSEKTILPGKTLVLYAEKKVTQATVNTMKKMTNKVTVSGKTTKGTETNKPEDTAEVEVLKPDMNIEKTSNTDGRTLKAGDKITYTITISNNGETSGDAVLTDEIPSTLTLDVNSVKANNTAIDLTTTKNKVVGKITSLPAGEKIVVEYKATVNTMKNEDAEKGVVITNTAKLEPVSGKEKESSTTDNASNPVINTAKTSSIKTSSLTDAEKEAKKVAPGDEIAYVITITNSGKVASDNLTITESMPNGLTVKDTNIAVKDLNGETKTDGSSNVTTKKNSNLTWEGIVGAEEKVEITIVATVDDLDSGKYELKLAKNTVKVDNTPTTDDNEYTVVKPHITTAKTSKIASCENNITTGTTVHVGDEIEYTITINNDGTDSGTISEISDQIKDGLTYIKDSLTKTLTGENINTETDLSKITFDETTNKVILAENSNITLNAGSTLTIKFKAKVNDLGAGIYTGKIAANQVEVNGKTTPDDKGDYDVEKPEVESSKVVDKSTTKYGDKLTYTITAKNKGNVSSDVTIEDKLPSGVEYKAGSVTLNNKSISDDECYNSDTKTIKYTTKLAANSTVTLEFKVKVTETKVGKNIVNTATVNGEEKTATTKTYKTISVTKQKDKPTDLILVLDVSGSMANSGEIANLKVAAKDLVDSVLYEGGNENSEVTLIKYSSTAKNLGSYKYKNLTELEGKISNLSADGGTNFADALDKTIAAVESKDSIVVFLTDGAPTIPSNLKSEWDETVGNIENNSGSGFSNNTKSGIEERAKELNEKCDTIYAIGLGTDNLSENTYSYVEEVTGPQLDSDISFDTTNHTFTVTVTNNNNYEVTLASASASIRNVDSISSASDSGTIENSWRGKTVNWSNLNKAIPANSSITLTGNYEPYYTWRGNESNPGGNVSATAKANNSNEEDDLYTQVNGRGHYRNKQYNVINTKKFAKYLLGKISSTGNVVETNDIKKTLNDIAEDIKPKSKTYTFDTNNTAEIPATENITKVSVTIGDTTKEYTVDQVKAGLENGLKYVEGKGFEWTLSDDLVKQDLAISYMYKD